MSSLSAWTVDELLGIGYTRDQASEWVDGYEQRLARLTVVFGEDQGRQLADFVVDLSRQVSSSAIPAAVNQAALDADQSRPAIIVNPPVSANPAVIAPAIVNQPIIANPAVASAVIPAAVNPVPAVPVMPAGNFCPICVKTFANRGNFKIHFGNAHMNKPRISCNACGESYKTQETFDRHNCSGSRRQ